MNDLKRNYSLRKVGPSDVALLLDCIAGDPTAWETFYERFTNLFYHTISVTLRHFGVVNRIDDLSKEIFQETFLHFRENDCGRLKQFQGKNGCSLASWLRVVISRLVIDLLRKQRQKDISFEDDSNLEDIPLKSRLADTRPLQDEEMEEASLKVFLRKELDKLLPNDQLVIKLIYEDELPIEEVAKVLRLNAGAIYTRVSRIKEKLKSRAEEEKIL